MNTQTETKPASALYAALDEVGMMGPRSDYFDLWTRVQVEHVEKKKVNGVFVTTVMKAIVTVGHEFLDLERPDEPTVYNRSHVGAFAKDGSFWEFFGLGRGRNVCDQAISSNWQFRLFGTNAVWNKPAEVVA